MRQSTIPVILILTLLLISCSSKSYPVASSDYTVILPESKHMVSQTDDLSRSLENPYINVFGAWKVSIDMESLTAEEVPSRNAGSIGDIFDADLSQFLTVSPCTNCMRITGVTHDAWNDINLTIGLKHPFPNLDTRPDLHGFDVRTIFIMPSDQDHPNVSITLPDSLQVTASYSSILLNSDGLTSHYDSLVTDERYFFDGSDVAGTLNPFLRFFDDFGADAFDPLSPSGHNVMPTDSEECYRTAVLDGDKLTGNYVFYLVADVAYGHSAVFTNRTNPQYYLPWFNRTEAWRVEYWLENNYLNYYDPASTAQLHIQVFDWQHGVDVDPAYPDPANPDGIPQSSDIEQVIFSIPGCMDDLIVGSNPVSGSGTPDDPLEFQIVIVNENQASEYQRGLLAVKDEINGQTGRMAIPETPAGFPYDTQDILDYTMYCEILVPVNSDPEYTWDMYHTDQNLFIPFEDLHIAEESDTHAVNIRANYIPDPGHKKYLYQWDYDYDGVTFDVDGEDNPSPDIVLPTPGIHPIALRIITTSVPPQEYIYPLEVYTGGEVFNQTFDPSGSPQFSTGYSGGNPMIAGTDRFYLAFSGEVSEQRDIYLMIGDYFGNMEIFQVTDTPLPSQDPSIYVGNYSPFDEIYIVYSEYDEGEDESHIYSIYGELDGSGFLSGNIDMISDDLYGGSYFHPCLQRDANNLHAYYVRLKDDTSRIYHARSSSQARSWASEEWFARNGSDFQTNPTVTSDPDSLYVFWEEWMTSTGPDSDIWYARSLAGSFMDDVRNISYFDEEMIETNPCITDNQNDTVLTYVATSPSASEQFIYLKYIRYSPWLVMDYPVTEADTDTVFLSPSVSKLGSYSAVVYSSYNPTTNQIYLDASFVELHDAFGSISVDPLIESQYTGTADDNFDADPFPAAAAITPFGYSGVFVMAWRDFTNGSFDSSVVPLHRFGYINTAMFTRYLD